MCSGALRAEEGMHGTGLGSMGGSCELLSVSPGTSKEALSTRLRRLLAPHSGFLLSLTVREWQPRRTIVKCDVHL